MEETLETIQARHRKEQRDLQSRITNKKKNATKKTRKGVNNECAELERQLRERQERELGVFNGEADGVEDDGNGPAESKEDDGTEGISTRLEDTNLSDITTGATAKPATEKPPQPQQPSAQQQQQPAGKKRNRQKERLARRAAEQEAAASAAEAEAAGMTDHRSIEKTYLLGEFEANGLVEKEIRPDGHCLFAAVADQLEQRRIPLLPVSEAEDSSPPQSPAPQQPPPPPYRAVRRRATDYMEAHPDDFAPFLDEPLSSYVPRIRDTAEWGGQLELAALASTYGVEIKVVQDGRTETVEPSSSSSSGGGEEQPRETIWLAYYRHGYGLGEHYNSLRKKG
ncbi:hypothetical protein DL766_000059 [Monosporascus sp. MC13-8B]|uniref:OTU domain-containing protein n=1 Tax=Monosporascus cannonballus TaxID=155416 RepID=A0ABY0GZS2_9PEZI|nr:hypothetical protein DL762_008590 [Monosporascus cannonballus]RYO83320.1 hypothetical protein DL763_007917 [Monosporascus cannonballus]RYP40035.1 hypothetical protein DL766_000059 [Monosporascus sp. MC13-8B]